MTPPFTVPAVTVEPGGRMTFSGTASDDAGLKNVEISLRNNTTRENLGNDGTWGVEVTAGNYRISPVDIGGSTYNWTYTTPFNLSPGSYTFTVRATDDLDLTTSSTNRGQLTINAQVPGDLPPDTTMSFDRADRRVAAGQPHRHGHRRQGRARAFGCRCRTATPAATCSPTAPWRPASPRSTPPSPHPARRARLVARRHAADRRQLALHGLHLRHRRPTGPLDDRGHRRPTGSTRTTAPRSERHPGAAAERRLLQRRARSSSPVAPRTRQTQRQHRAGPGRHRELRRAVHELVGHVHEHDAELPDGVPQQPGQRGVELLVHDAGYPGRHVLGGRAGRRRSRPDQ